MSPPHAFLFAHGAGAPSTHPWMQGWARRLGELGAVQTFDYPYARAGRKAPDRQPALLRAHAQALDDLRAAHPGAPLVLVGKSMGARIGCLLAAQTPAPSGVVALVCLGFPLGTGTKAEVRAEALARLRLPVLLVQGSRDPLCPLPALQAALARRLAPSALHVVEGGDHSLLVPRRLQARLGITQDAVDQGILLRVAGFLTACRSGA